MLNENASVLQGATNDENKVQEEITYIENAQEPAKKKEKIAVCFGGGGMRGFTHVGAVLAFRELGIKFDMICGASIGALMSGLYAMDMDYETMVKHARNFNFKKLHNGIFFPSRSPMRIKKVIDAIVGDTQIEDLEVQWFTHAVDMRNGEQVIFDKGSLSEAITCSCNMPVLFKPYKKGDMLLADGGLKNNVPAETARMFGADKVITIDVNPGRGKGTNKFGYVSMIINTIEMAISNSSYRGLVSSDIVIAPDTSEFESFDNSRWEDMIQCGYKETMKNKDAILKIVNGR